MATVATRISLADHGRKMTMQEFLDAEAEEGYRYELGRGILEVTHVPGEPHGQVVCNLYRVIVLYDQAHPGVILRFGGGNEFRLWLPGLVSGRNPDLSVVLRDPSRDPRRLIRPVLVAEVVSKSSVDRDHRTKREEYLAYGLLEYWIIDFLQRKMTVLVRDGDVWVEHPCVDGQPIPSLVLRGLTATMADLWVDLDFYDRQEDDEVEDDPENGNEI